MKPRSLVRIVVVAAAMTLGPGLLSASCVTADDAAAPDVPPNGKDASTDHTTAKPNPTCPPPTDAVSRCSGSDPSFTFFPSFTCAAILASDAGAPDADASSDDAGDAANPCFGVTTFDTIFTPAACSAFAGAESRGEIATDGGTRAPTLDEPSDGDILTADTWSIFAWTKGTTARRGPLNRALDLLEPSAHAFPALRGDAYVLEFTVGCTEILRVMLAETSWAPDPAAWAILTNQTQPVNVRVIWMKFADDALASGSTPVASSSITITMKH